MQFFEGVVDLTVSCAQNGDNPMLIGCMILKKLDLLVKNAYSLNFFLFFFFVSYLQLTK